MLDRLLQTRLEPVVERYRQRRLAIRLARYYGVALLLALGILIFCALAGWRESWLAPVVAVAVFLGALVTRLRYARAPFDSREVARELERENPRLHALLLTAVEQETDAGTGALNFLQDRVVREALEFNRQHPWGHRSYEHLFFARAAQGMALTGLVVVAAALFILAPLGGGASVSEVVSGLEVTPGDASVERGDALVVLARFGGRVPAEAVLVISPREGEVIRLPLARNLDDPVFGGRIDEVRGDLAYRVEYEGESTRDFEVTAYDLPRLERADAHLSYPDYTGLEGKSIENTRRVSAVEGTRVRYVLELNKPVASATWVERDRDAVLLHADATRSNVVALEFTLDRNARYALRLVDQEGRTNRVAEQFVLEVFTNQPPELKLVSPRGDDRVSPLEEVAFRAQASDDFGLRAYGLGYRFGAGETELLELGAGGARHEPRVLERVLALESMAVRPGQLLTYFLWADDVGPDGQVRRTFSDIYFLEVRPFEEIFRENQSGAGEEQGGGGQGQPGSPSEPLTELQKEIIAATWGLQRRGTPRVLEGFVDDARVIQQSQEHALEQAVALAEDTNDPGAREWVETARTEMGRAVRELERAGTEASAGPLGPALGAEQAAYEALLQLQTREYQVAQGQRGQGGGNQGGRRQRQLNQLQLKASEDRYETQRQATPEVDPQQREQLQFLSRLKELAQRQQDLNQRLRELELALQEAATPEEREEVRRELRRLREQQQQMLSDVDELHQRMERPGNQAETAEARRQLEEARDQLQSASEAIEQGSLSQAVASGSRASRQLEELREDFRTRNASQFSEAMREMRGQARDLVEQQEQLARELDALSENRRPTLSDAEPREDLARLAAEQVAGLTNLLDRVRQVTEESETAEPLLSRDLYETFRQAAQTDAANLREVTEELLSQGALTRPVYDMLRFPDREGPGQSLATTERLLREGHLDAARQLEEKARADLGQLQRGIERAAEKILGDDTEALRLARSELDELLEQLEQEIAEGRAASGLTNAVASQAGGGRNGGQPGGADESSAGRRSGGGDRGDSDATPGEPSDSGGEGETEGAALFFNQPEAGPGGGAGAGGGPVTGGGYRDWANRLGEVEDLLDSPDLRTEVARVRDRVRVARSEFNRHGEAPRWDMVELEMASPLGEVRDRLIQELARRQSPEALVPIDRDLVPPRYSELVRRYYENLGATE